MDTLVHADIFFFISSIAVVVFTIFVCVFGFYLIKIMKNFSGISEKLRDGVNDADTEIREISEQVRDSAIFSFIFGKKKKTPRVKK